MKKSFATLALSVITPIALFCTDVPESQPVNIDAVSETFGHLLVQNLKDPIIKINIEMMIKGMQDEIAGKPAPMTEEQYIAAINQLQQTELKKLAASNLEAANAFLAKNAKEKGVVVLDDGKLQYLIIKQGAGESVKEHSTPLINYTGTYIDGTVFNSSLEAGEPIALPLDQAITGFAQGIVGMKVGEIRKIFVHPDLGYGTRGQLPPNSLLIFEVEVIKANTDQEVVEIIEEESSVD